MSRPLRLAAPAAALGLAACAVGPNYRPPATPAAAAAPFVSARAGIAAAEAPPSDWWRLYDDPALDALVKKALTENQDLKVAAANLLKARGVVEQARAGLFPSTDVSFADQWGVSSGNQLVSGLLHRKATPAWFATGALDVSYQVDIFGRIRRSLEAARADAAATAEAENVVRITVAAETARAYADACAFAEQAATARKSAGLAQQVLDLTRRQRDLGAKSDFDVASAAAVFDQARAEIPTFDGEQRAQLFELAVLTGDLPSQVSQAAAACRTPPTIRTALPVGDGAALLRRRPDVLQAEATLAADTARIGVATADYFPTVSLTGSGSPSGASTKQFFSSASFSYQLGPLITWSFPNVLVAHAEVAQAKAQASASIAAFDSVMLTALKETEQALTTYDAELSHHAALAANRDDNQRAFDLAQIQLQRGSISFPDLLQTERNLETAEAQLAASDQALVDDQVAVFQALGGGWETAPPVVPPKAP
ncbi:MAG TPA: TolC family protein [Caulobacteraceae bacterium]|jgi:NodT family efflux transporter outer membrane factor (OMF) lipoprotein